MAIFQPIYKMVDLLCHHVKSFIDGHEVPVPFNLNSIRKIFPNRLADRLEQKLLETSSFNAKVPILELLKTKDKNLIFLANYIYEKVFLNYTLKQWCTKPEELDKSVTARVTVCISMDG
jgi:UDP-galactopyranose mutase